MALDDLNMSGQFSQNQGMLTSALGGFTDFLKKKPELFAIMADKLGSSIAPNNPLAGVGTNLAKSSLASKAETERKTREQGIMKLVESLTMGNLPGGNAITIKPDKEGNPVLTYSSTLSNPASATREVSTNPGQSQSGLLQNLGAELQRKAIGG